MRKAIGSVAVFCGARHGHDPVHAAAARALGAGIAAGGRTLVYGGGGVGLMGEVAEAAIAAGGQVRGIIPEFLTKLERPHPALVALEVTGNMHSRKTRMYELADAFVAMSGGIGTLDELVEVITWRQLGLHDKPVLLLDVNGWAQPFARLFEHYIAEGFVAPGHRRLFQVLPDVPAVLAALAAADAPAGQDDSARL